MMQKLINTLLTFATLVVFIGLVALLFVTPKANALVWTLVIPLVPITLLVIGYSRWRIVCPLAWFTKITQNLTLFSKRKLPFWFENNVYFVQFAILFWAFTARLYVLNSDALMLGVFFISVISLAILSGLFLSGKSWCNYLCPVGVVEKIYTGSNAHMSHIDSACSTCSACKKNCPDIDMESSYWKETSNQQKKFVFYAFPGLVFGFYFYYFLEAGTWDYYFSGTWTLAKESDTPLLALFQSGFYFLPQIPKLIAAPLSLLLAVIVSFYIFSLFEKLFQYLSTAKEKDMEAIEHITKVFAAFIAFNIFYVFAGAPTFSQYPTSYALFHFIVIVLSAIFLWKEIHREGKFFIQERFARKILKKWSGAEVPSKNLKEIYYTYANQQKDHSQYLENYKETIFELMGDGVLTQESMKLLDKMRTQLGITPHEHKTIINSLEKEHAELFEENSHMTAEKLFQLKGYKEMLKQTLEENKTLSELELEQMRKHFQITVIEHEKILNELMNSEGILKDKIFTAIKEITALYKINTLLPNSFSIAADYLKFNIEHEITTHLQNLEKILPLICKSENISKLITVLWSDSLDIKDINFADEASRLIVEELFIQKGKESVGGMAGLGEVSSYIYQYEFKSLYPSLLLVLLTENLDNSCTNKINQLTKDNDVLAGEVATILLSEKEGMSTIQKEALLHAVPLFHTLSPEYIEMLAQNIIVKSYVQGDYIVKQGDDGDALYILSKGSASILINTLEGGQKKVAEVSINDYIGEIALFSGEKRTASVQANEAVEALELSVDTLKKVLYYSPGISFDMMRQMTLRLLPQTKV
ncbi:MAG: cyclic nucleotide-binding domain-containing protein [Sulfuricurvum sp.]|jgi:hypothetical protein